ncbi:hypothetical protein SK128_012796 [Halocaridina rubra]|uniref:Uncharacterized protein n=1 Tax=Halocaridina rubra TaxID=373956 RepID=A0AAN9AHB3_HALRR
MACLAEVRVVLFVAVCCLPWLQCSLGLHPHTHLPTQDLIRARGYPAEVHHVLSEDGYILELHRIPGARFSHSNSSGTSHQLSIHPCDLWDRFGCRLHLHKLQIRLDPKDAWMGSLLDNCTASDTLKRLCGRSSRNGGLSSRGTEKQRVVFLQHGVLCSSADFVMNDPDQALGFVLADLGYDVWIGNVRGNVYGRRHITLSPKQSEFWNFSWDKMAQYDMPAMLSYVRLVTGVSQLEYVGHSMGTTIFFAMMNYHPHINNWIRKMAAIAPSAYIHHTFIGYRALSPIVNFINRLQILDGTYKKYEQGNFSLKIKNMLSRFCAPSSLSQQLCKSIINIVGGPSLSNSIDNEYLPVIVAHTPAGGSNNIFAHYGQLIMARNFQAYDNGETKNLLAYGTGKPPVFSLKAVTTPVALFWSESDWVNSPPDVRQIAGELSRVVLSHRVEREMFNHLDFIWSEDAHIYVYRPLIKFLNTQL